MNGEIDIVTRRTLKLDSQVGDSKNGALEGGNGNVETAPML